MVRSRRFVTLVVVALLLGLSLARSGGMGPGSARVGYAQTTGWVSKAPMLVPRAGFAAASYAGGKFYVFGGTPDGTFNLSEGSSNPGTTSYAFSGVVKHNMTVYSTCSVSVS